jgi:hypothetical protein
MSYVVEVFYRENAMPGVTNIQSANTVQTSQQVQLAQQVQQAQAAKQVQQAQPQPGHHAHHQAQAAKGNAAPTANPLVGTKVNTLA